MPTAGGKGMGRNKRSALRLLRRKGTDLPTRAASVGCACDEAAQCAALIGPYARCIFLRFSLGARPPHRLRLAERPLTQNLRDERANSDPQARRRKRTR